MTHRSKILATHKRVGAEIEAMKRAVAKEIKKHIEDNNLTQNEASYAAVDAPSQISLICTGKLRGFSLERLIRIRAMLGASVKLQVTESQRPQVSLAA